MLTLKAKTLDHDDIFQPQNRVTKLYRFKLKDLLQQRLTTSDTLLPLSCIGILVGIASGLSMVGLHQLITLSAELFPSNTTSDFEHLNALTRASIPLAASLLLILFFVKLPNKLHNLGILYVIERLNYHKGNLSLTNALVQFIAATISLAGGLSIGKEGPAVHIGATFGSKLADYWRLSIQSRETLIACGAAGAISAAFQTPLAGVLFALEVIFLGFQSTTILPIILSSVFAMIVSQICLGSITLFHFDSTVTLELDLNNILALLALSISITFLAGLFYRTQKLLWKFNSSHLAWRFIAVGAITAVCAVFIPETLGVGYDSLELLLSGKNISSLIIIVLLIKVLLTAISIGLGIPGGLIGPTFLIGGLAGIQTALWYFTNPSIELISLFALLGMATMMATTLQAPLAALIGIIEINHTSNIILPAMLVIGLSCVLSRVILRQDSIFIERLKNKNLMLQNHINRFLNNEDLEQLTQEVEQLPKTISLDRLITLQSSLLEYATIETDRGMALVRMKDVLALIDKTDTNEIDLTVELSRYIIQFFDMPIPIHRAITHFKLHNTPFALIQNKNHVELRLLERNQLNQSLSKR